MRIERKGSDTPRGEIDLDCECGEIGFCDVIRVKKHGVYRYHSFFFWDIHSR